MVHIILLLLKIIGWILLAILGILIVLFLTVLFSAVKYKVKGSADGTFDSVRGRIDFCWLFHLVRGYFHYENGNLKYEIRILWKRIPGNGEKKVTEEPEVEEAERILTEMPEKAQKELPKIPETFPEPENSAELPEGQKPQEKEIVQLTSKKDSEHVKTEVSGVRTEKEVCNEKERKSILQKLYEKYLGIKEKISRFFNRIKYTLQGICDKINTLSEKKEQAMQFLQNETHIAAFHRGILELKRILRFLKPKKLKMNLQFGFEDPYITGQVLAAAAMLYPFLYEQAEIEPDFEKAVLKGNVLIQGCIRPVYFVIVGGHLLLDKNIRMTYKDIRKITG